MAEDNVEDNKDLENSVESSTDTQDNSDGEISFDPKAFMSHQDETSSLSDNDDSSDDDESHTSETSSSDSNSESHDDDSANGFSWDSMSSSTDTEESQSDSDTNLETDTSSQDEPATTNDVDQNDPSGSSESSSSASVDLSAIGERLGVEESTPEAINAKLESLISENEKLRTSANTNEKITNLQNLKRIDNTELVKKDLKAQGFSDEDINLQLEVWEGNGTMRLEANKVRNKIDSMIRREQYDIEQSQKQSVERERQDDVNRRQALKEHIDGVEQMFGMNISKDPANYQNVRDDHYKYISDGQFAQEIGQDMESLSQAAWLWKNREVILKAMKSSGRNTGRKEILDSMSNVAPNTSSSTSNTLPPNPDDNSEAFDPKKFMSA